MSSLSGTAKMTTYAKRKVAESMYHKGLSFVGAAVLLREKSGYAEKREAVFCAPHAPPFRGSTAFRAPREWPVQGVFDDLSRPPATLSNE
jgi:hypothetical protein